MTAVKLHKSSHSPRARGMRLAGGFVGCALLATVVCAGGFSSSAQATQTPSPIPTSSVADTELSTSQPSTTPTAPPTLSSQATAPQLFLNILSPMSYTVVVDKHRPLNPTDWVPPDIVEIPGIANPNGQGLRATAASALEAMNAEASANGVSLVVNFGYRSFDTQTDLYGAYVDRDGLQQADISAARPGFSEHQTGLAVDITDGIECGYRTCFGDTNPGQWVAANAYRYGFIVRYPDGLTAITGYMYEPWHLRYIGVQPATMMHDQGVATLEEFFHLEAAPDYLG